MSKMDSWQSTKYLLGVPPSVIRNDSEYAHASPRCRNSNHADADLPGNLNCVDRAIEGMLDVERRAKCDSVSNGNVAGREIERHGWQTFLCDRVVCPPITSPSL